MGFRGSMVWGLAVYCLVSGVRRVVDVSIMGLSLSLVFDF